MRTEHVGHILREIKSIYYYKTRLDEIEATLSRLGDEIQRLGEPRCPLGNMEAGGGLGVTKGTRMLELIGEEQEVMKLKEHYLFCLKLAKDYKEQVLACCTQEERLLMLDYINGDSYSKLERVHHVSNAYSSIRTIVKRIEIKGC